MPHSLQGAIDYARSHPTRDGGSWAGWCASFCYRAGGFSQAFTSAQVAGDNAGWLNPDWASAPPGAVHYWSGVGGLGHCAFEMDGNGRLLMASNAVTDRWGTAVGTISFSQYAQLGIPYRGWSLRWGAETLSGSSTAGGGYSPIQEDDMYDANARFEVVSRLDQMIQELRNHDARTARYELVRLAEDPQVWLSHGRVFRVRVRDEQTLKDYAYFLSKIPGQSDKVRIVGNLEAFGAEA